MLTLLPPLCKRESNQRVERQMERVLERRVPPQSHESKLIINGIAGSIRVGRNFRFLLATISVIINSVH
jgi:hypothetical protein